MRNGDADKRAEKPEPNRKDSGGTVTDTDEGRQTRTARHEQVGIEEGMLLEKVLERENVLAAYRRVKANSGAAGIDGMTVEDLMPHCQMHWTRVRQELLDETYRPQPVRKVDILKPDGGIRTLGIPTVMDRMIQQALLQVLQPLWDRTFSEDSATDRDEAPKRRWCVPGNTFEPDIAGWWTWTSRSSLIASTMTC